MQCTHESAPNISQKAANSVLKLYTCIVTQRSYSVPAGLMQVCHCHFNLEQSLSNLVFMLVDATAGPSLNS